MFRNIIKRNVMKIIQKDYIENQNWLMTKCHLLGWGHCHHVPEMCLVSLMFFSIFEDGLGCAF